MEVKASVRGVRIGNLKVFPMAELIKGKDVHQANRILSVQKQKSARILKSLMGSAIANAENKKTIDVNRLYVKNVTVDRGPHRHSFIPRARGRASSIIKRSSHICVVLGEK